MQNQLLHAPVVEVGDIELVFGWTGDTMSLTDLFELTPGRAQHAHDLAVQGQLVDPAREGIVGIQVLDRTRRDANRPGRARRERPRREWSIGRVAEHLTSSR